MSMNNSQVRVINPILTNVALGYGNQTLVGNTLFPRVPVQVAGGQVLEFGTESFRLYNARRAPGADTKRVDFGYLGKPFALYQDSLEGKVPFEYMRDASRVPGINLGTRAVNGVMRSLSLGLEKEQADIARNAANYDADHKVDLSAAKWTDDANNPNTDLDTGKTAVADSIGMEPNTLVLSRAAFYAAKNNAKVIERFKYTSKESITAEMLAALWDLDRVVVGKAITFDDKNVSTYLWGSDAILAYVPEHSEGMEEPSYAYTYTMEGNPMAEQPYQDRGAKSWIYPVVYERAPVLCGMSAGYLLQNVG